MSEPQPNADLAPVPLAQRTWNAWHFAGLWVGMAVCIPTYTLASGLLAQGMRWDQALWTILLGNLIVLIPLALNAHAGARYGIPFPVLLRASFGLRGANVPALMRALVACGWFGIQTWIGGAALYTMLAVLFGFAPAESADALPILGLSLGQFGCFLLFWSMNMVVVWYGMEAIKRLEVLAAPLLLLMGLGLLAWSLSAAGGLDVVFADTTFDRIRGATATSPDFSAIFWPSLTAVVGFWATLSLNIPDFTRYARSQRDHLVGQALGLPTTMTLFAFVGITATCASVVLFGEVIWDPVLLVSKFDAPLVVVFALALIVLATLSTNIAANVVSPANDFTQVWPRRLSFRRGGLLTGLIGIAIFPWRLYTDLSNYIFTWLIGYGTLLGSIAGIMLVDYYVIRRTQLDLDGLYQANGPYAYQNGVNPRAILALVLGCLPALPGFFAQATGGFDVSDLLQSLYTHGWFVSLAVSGIVYFALMRSHTPSN
ncbi:MAG: NCS1 family nucleobase:cation symporter-1 [Rhodothermales bacterium]